MHASLSPSTALRSLLAERRQESERQWVDQRRQQLLERIKRNECVPIKMKRAVSAPRDPKRLLRPTTATTARRLPADDDHAEPTKRTKALAHNRGCSYILDVQSR